MMNQRKKTTPENLAHRSVEIKERAIDEENRTVEIAFSSESVVERYYGTEVLDHRAESVRLDRINNGGAFLMEHDRNDQIGVVERAWIDADKKGRAIVKFSKSARAQEIFQDVKDGIRRLVSVGYRIHEERSEKLDGGREAVTATDWEPYELSLVSIPADDSVGVGRAMEDSTDNNKNNTMSDQKTPEKTAPETAPQKRSVEVINEAPKVDANKERETGATQERSRIDALNGIAEAAKTRGLMLDVNKAVRDGVSPQDFQGEAFRQLTEKHTDYTPANELSKSEKRDLEKFDLGKVVRSLVEERGLDGLERDVIADGRREAKECGIGVTRGATLPGYFVKRDMTATGGTGGDQGGMTIATEKAGLLDDFYNASIMRQLGATVMTGLVGNFDVPRLVAGTDPAGKAENASADEVSPTTADLNMNPNRLPAYIDLSDQLLMQSSSAIEAIVRGSLTAQMNAVQEAAFFHGTGTAMAEGIAATSGIGSVAGGTNGAAPTYANIVALEEKVDAQNAMLGSLAYATNGQIRAKLKQTPKQSSGVEGNFVISDLNADSINGYRALFTNAISRTLTKGTSNVASAIFFGNFTDYIIGYWGGLNLELLRDSSNAITGLHRLVASTYYDGGVRRPKSFAAMLDALGA